MRRTLLLWSLLLIALPSTASAEWHFTPSFGATILGNTTLGDPELAAGDAHIQLGGSVAFLSHGWLGVEGVTVWTPHFFRGGSPDVTLVTAGRTFALMGNAVLTTPQRLTEYSLRPYISGGAGLMHALESTTKHAADVTANRPGFDIGGGAIGFLSPRVGIRFDFRYFSTFNSNAAASGTFGPLHLRYAAASIGVVIRR